MSYTLYFAPKSCAFVSLVALEEGEVDYSAVKLDLANGAQNAAEFRSVSPRGRVPVLVADGEVIPESVAILSYVAAQAPAGALLPENPIDEAKAMAKLSWYASGVHVSFAQIFRGNRFTDDPEAIERLKQDAMPRVLAALDEIETDLQGKWVMGDAFSVCDPYLAVFWRWAEEKLGCDMTRWPKIGDLVQRLYARPAVQRALSREQA
ncbi:MAG: glutathione S-transferase N-terminal domain-containing protein [Novosphingobium sp.]